MKLKKDGTPRKSGSGRTKGSVSLVSVKRKALVERFTNDNDLIVVGRIFAEKAGLSTLAPAVSAPPTQDQKAGIKIITV